MPNWAEYLDAFHAERAGVTESVLQRAVSGRHTPYHWLSRAVSSRATLVLDIACGSGAMSRELTRPDRVVIGVDLAEQELAKAAGRSAGPWVRADARVLPFADESVDAVTSTLGLAVIHPTSELLSEVARVLKPGGVFAAMTPTVRPLSMTDMATGLVLAHLLRTAPQFPVSLEFASAPLLHAFGLRKMEDARERYRFPVRSREDADLVLSALYLPTTAPDRVEEAAQYLERQAAAKGHIDVPIPMRRIVAIK